MDTIALPDISLILWHRKPLLFLGMASALILGALYYAQATPTYESSAELLIVQKRPDVVSDSRVRSTQVEDYVSTHTVLVESPLIIEKAIATDNLAELGTFQNIENDLTLEIAELLRVDRGSKDLGKGADSILTLAFVGPDPKDCQVVTRAIVESYRSFLDETYRDMGEDTVKLLSMASDTLKLELAEQEGAYRDFREQSPLIPRGNTDANPLQERLATIESELSELLIKKTNIQAQLQSIERAKTDNPEQLVAMISDLANRSNDEPYQRIGYGLDMDREVFALLQEKQQIQQNYGPNHPFSKAIRKQIDKTRDFFTSPNAAYSVASESVEPDPTTRYVNYLNQELARLELSEDLLNQLYDSEHSTAKQLSTYQLRDEEYARNIERTQALYDGVIEQLQGASLVKDYGGFNARVIAAPRMGEKVSPRAPIIGISFMMLGTLAGLALVAIAELRDNKLRTVDEVRRQLGYAIVGQIPKFESNHTFEGSLVDGAIRAFHDPKGTSAEAFRAVRTSLYFSTRNSGEKIIQVTSACPGDGKSTTAANIAVVVAQSGKRVLLIDADLRRPQQHRLFGLPISPGLSSVIAQDSAPEEAIRESEVSNLSVMPSGEIPGDPSEMVTSQVFADLLDGLREQYDYILVDTGPLLAISDPAAVAARADGTLIAFELLKSNRSQTRKVKEILSSFNANVLGVVLNRVSSRTLGYGYGYGNYSYGDNQELVVEADEELAVLSPR